MRHKASLLPLLGTIVLTLCCAADEAEGDPPDTALAAVGAPEPPPPPPMVAVAPDNRGQLLDLSDSTRSHLRLRQWAEAAADLGAMKPDELDADARAAWAFVLSWCLVHSDQAAKAAPYTPLFEGSGHIPADYAALVRGEVLLAQDKPAEALAELQKIPDGATLSPRVLVVRAAVLRDLDRHDEAWTLYEQLVQRPDPAVGNAEALLALCERHGSGSPQAYTYARRVWTHYPKSEHSRAAAKILADYPGDEHRPTWQEVARRSEHLMDDRDYAGAIREIDRVLGQVGDDRSIDACRLLFAKGRSNYRMNRLSAAIEGFGDAGERCTDLAPEDDYGARALYLTGRAQYRKSRFEASAQSMAAIADRYPGSTLADDGLTHAGIALQENDDLAGAQAMWRRALDEFPNGDLAPEATWRLAWSLYLDHKPDEARAIADRLGALDLHGSAVDVRAGLYWSARWALYPDVDNPTVPVQDLSRREAALAGWADLLRKHPQSFYAILAYSRILELDPPLAAELSAEVRPADRGVEAVDWKVRPEWWEQAPVRDGYRLARLGLITDAMAEWQTVDFGETPDEMALLTDLRIGAGDWLIAHDWMRTWLRSHPVGTLGERQAAIVRLAYPDRYWTEIQQAAQDDRFEPRLFHALSREESNFNRNVISHAGAIGLSQLMPATADQVAGWLGTSVNTTKLKDPVINTRIGARYLDALHKQHNGSPYLSLAAYNAGAGRVKQWKERFGNVPTDEYVEHIPFRETRGYVKRVMGTWQVYRWQFDDNGPFPDLSAFNHQALPPE